jgi:hypothetical protein
MKASELSGVALNWAVAICEGYKPKDFCPHDKHFRDEEDVWFSPSDDWAQGGAIIERENISITGTNFPWWECDSGWYAHIGDLYSYGPTPLIAAMRCFVASKLGKEIELPEELEATA